MIKRLVLYIIIGVAALAACKPRTPRQYIQPDEMEDILVDYHLGQAMAQVSNYQERDYNKTLYLAAVLEKHHVSRAEFDSSLIYYYTRADRFMTIYRRVSDRLQKQAVALGASESEVNKYAQMSLGGDTANIWTLRDNALLFPTPPYNRIDFEAEVDTAFRQGDHFLFNFTSDFLMQTGSRSAYATLCLKYTNDSVVCRSQNIMGGNLVQLRIEADPKLKIKRLWGYIYMDGGAERSSNLRILFLSHLQLIRFHQQKHEEDNNKEDSSTPPDTARTVALPESGGRRDTVGHSSQILPLQSGAVGNRMVGRNH